MVVQGNSSGEGTATVTASLHAFCEALDLLLNRRLFNVTICLTKYAGGKQGDLVLLSCP